MRHENLFLSATSEDIARATHRIIWIVATSIIAIGWLNEAVLHIPLLDLADTPTSLANWVEPILLAMIAGLSFITSRACGAENRPESRYWIGLSLLFGALSLDEAVSAHEQILKPLRTTYGSGAIGIWMAPAFLGVLVSGICVAPLLRYIPAKSARLLVRGGLVFVGGCIVSETLSQCIAIRLGVASSEYRIVASLEETMEIVGSALIISCLIDHFRARWATIIVRKHV